MQYSVRIEESGRCAELMEGFVDGYRSCTPVEASLLLNRRLVGYECEEVNGEIIIDQTDKISRDAEATYDRQIEKINFNRLAIELAYVVAELADIADLSTLPATRRNRINATVTRMKKVVKVRRDQVKAKRDFAAGTKTLLSEIGAIDIDKFDD